MKLNQNGLIGVLAEADGLKVANRLEAVQCADPDNPVLLGYNTVVEAPPGTAWEITGPNLLVRGVGRQLVALPVGDYEITTHPAGSNHSLGRAAAQ